MLKRRAMIRRSCIATNATGCAARQVRSKVVVGVGILLPIARSVGSMCDGRCHESRRRHDEFFTRDEVTHDAVAEFGKRYTATTLARNRSFNARRSP